MSKVILVLIDGLGYETMLGECGWLEGLVERGRARRWRMLSILPSLSLPAYASLHTGTAPDEHGYTTNTLGRRCEGEHVFSVARAAGRSTAAIANWFFAELFLGGPYDPVEQMHHHDPEGPAIEHGRFFREKGYTPFNIGVPSDDDLCAQATALVRDAAPDYLLLHLMACDQVGHIHGGDSPQYRKQARVTEAALADYAPRWMAAGHRVLVTADHGMSHEADHGGTHAGVREVAFYDLGAEPGSGGVAEGPSVGGAVEGPPVSQLSVAPTVLDLMGLPIPAAMKAPLLVG